MAQEPDRAYMDLPGKSQHGLGIGGALISMVEPHPGHEYAYNRWYEDDHYYSGALFMPWMFAGRAVRRHPRPAAAALPATIGRSRSR